MSFAFSIPHPVSPAPCLGGGGLSAWQQTKYDYAPMTTPDSAYQIAEDLLTRTGAALMASDFDRFAQCFSVPLVTESFRGQRHVTTQDDLRAVFDAAVEHYQVQNVTDMVRRVVSAAYHAPDMIHTVHESRLLSHSLMLDQHTSCFSRVRRIGSIWKIDLTRYANVNAPRFDAILSGADRAAPQH